MKVYERTEDGTVTRVSIQEGLAEVNHAMMEGKRQVKTMSSQYGRHDITYKDGRHVLLVQVDEPETSAEPKPANLQTHTGTVHAPGRYNKRVRGNVPKCCTSASAIARMHYLVDVDAPVTCKRCLAALAKEGA